jgi:hypothetical protein
MKEYLREFVLERMERKWSDFKERWRRKEVERNMGIKK